MQFAVDTKRHLIVAHEVTIIGNDRTQLASMAKQDKVILGKEYLDVYANRGYHSGLEILACEESGMVPLVPKSLISGKGPLRYMRLLISARKR